MTTGTQWVRNVADSHRNISRLQRLSFRCPMKVSQDRPPESVPVGSDWRESFEPRLCRWGCRKPRQTAPGGIAMLHLDNGFKEFLVGSCCAGPTPALG